MKLDQFVKSQGITLKAFHKNHGSILGVSYGYLRLLSCGAAKPSLSLALKLQATTHGRVRPEDFI